jgi:hypothetical protein
MFVFSADICVVYSFYIGIQQVSKAHQGADGKVILLLLLF